MRLKTAPTTRSRGLVLDQGGATMVMGVFMAVLLVGMIYYVWGVGDAVMHRERMQDASDTAAFSAAVMHARGMNLLALINMVMAALAIVAATMATIAAMIGWAFAAAAFVCGFCGPYCGACCNACEPAARHGEEYVEASADSADTTMVVDLLMQGLHGYAQGIRTGVPIASQAKVMSYGTDVYAPVTDAGFMAPLSRVELPAQDDETDWPCNEKVLPWVRALSPALVWLWGSPSIYMVGGIGLGEVIDAPRESREWCEDGYFQRIIDPAHTMGNGEYQVQAYMIGDPDFEWTAEGVAVATWGEGDDAGSRYTTMAEMGRVSFAQAEFFYDDSEGDWHEWLWHMNWRARLRRWRLEDSGAGGAGMLEACGSACGPLGALGGSIDDAVVH